MNVLPWLIMLAMLYVVVKYDISIKKLLVINWIFACILLIIWHTMWWYIFKCEL